MVTSVVVCGVAADIELEGALSDVLGLGVRFVLEPSYSQLDPTTNLVVGIYPRGYEAEQKCFGLWTQATELAALTVEVGTDELIIGPLSLPGRGGCGYCAHARLAAASGGESGYRTLTSCSGVNAVALPVLAGAIRAILRNGFAESSELDHVLICDLKTGRASRHRVIPLPWCPVCGGASRRLGSTKHAFILSPEEEPETLLNALAGWVDARTGVVSCIQFELPEDGREVPIIATASPPHILRDDGSLRRLPVGWGKGLSLSAAILSAVGEAIERYSASLPDHTRIIWERCDLLDGEFLDPRAFAFYSEPQYDRMDFPFVRFDPGIPHPWVSGSWADDGAPVWVPALCAFLSIAAGPEHLFSQGTSNGLAASTSIQDAAMRALFELIERDAFMTAWLTGTSGERIELGDTLDPELRQVLEGIEALGARVEFYTLPTCALGTAILCLALGDGTRYPGVTIGLAADLDPLRAVQGAILELAQTGPHLRRLMHSQRLAIPEMPQAVREMLDHAAYYFPAERVAAFERLRNAGTTLELRHFAQYAPASTRSFKSCASELRTSGIRVALVDVTSPDVSVGPFRVVRAVSPDLQPISYGYGLDFKPVERVRLRGLASEIPPIHPIW